MIVTGSWGSYYGLKCGRNRASLEWRTTKLVISFTYFIFQIFVFKSNFFDLIGNFTAKRSRGTKANAHWDMLNKENSNLVALFIMSQCVICSPVWLFCTTWSLSLKGLIIKLRCEIKSSFFLLWEGRLGSLLSLRIWFTVLFLRHRLTLRATFPIYSRLALDHGVKWNRTKIVFFRCLWRHCRPLVKEINMAEYMKKFIDLLHIPPYLFLWREDDDDVRDFGKHDFRSVLHVALCYLMLNYSQLSTWRLGENGLHIYPLPLWIFCKPSKNQVISIFLPIDRQRKVLTRMSVTNWSSDLKSGDPVFKSRSGL